MATRTLSNEQLEAFDSPYEEGYFRAFERCVERDFGDSFSLLDIGGGNGGFADRVLARWPRAMVSVADNSAMMLAKNRPDPRKRLVERSATDLSGIGRFDIVCFNCVLHHLVGASYALSLSNIQSALANAGAILNERGRVSVNENPCNGIVFDRAPGRILYSLTSARSIANIVRAAGGNTAGVGVCFQSTTQWKRHFANAGLRTLHDERFPNALRPPWKQAIYAIALHLKPEHPEHFWLAK